MLTIGQLARIFEISTKTLRHYDAIGLFVPARTGSDNGYRYYQPEQIEQPRAYSRCAGWTFRWKPSTA